MTDYIERGGIMALIEAEERLWGEDYDVQQVLGDIEDFPAADVRPVARGRWIGAGEWCCLCSECNQKVSIQLAELINFCPNCGAEMVTDCNQLEGGGDAE